MIDVLNVLKVFISVQMEHVLWYQTLARILILIQEHVCSAIRGIHWILKNHANNQLQTCLAAKLSPAQGVYNVHLVTILIEIVCAKLGLLHVHLSTSKTKDVSNAIPAIIWMKVAYAFSRLILGAPGLKMEYAQDALLDITLIQIGDAKWYRHYVKISIQLVKHVDNALMDTGLIVRVVSV